MDLLRIKSRSRSPGRSSSSSNDRKKRTPTTSPAGIRDGSDAAPYGDHVHLQRVASKQQQQQEGYGYAGGAAMSSKTTGGGGVPAPLDITGAKENMAPVQVVEFSFPSLLSPPNPAFVSGSDARGILMNARRPASREPNDSNTPVSGTSAQSPSKSKTIAAQSALSQSRPQLRSTVSADSISTSRNGTPEQAVPNFGGAESNNADSDKFNSVASRKIRFAPLPDPRRPRRYSTGRDIWLDDDPEMIHINTRGGLDVRPEDWNHSYSMASPMSMTGSRDSMDDNDSPTYGSLGSNSNHKRSTSSTSSITSKLLNPLKLGRSKSRDKDLKRTSSLEASNNSAISPSSYSSVSNWLTGGGEPLGRRISTGTLGDSPASERQRAEEFRSSGVPLRKSNTQESDGGGLRPRKAYPSVAQGANRRRANLPPARVEEPVFMEWTNPTAGNNIAGTDEFDDDGSGMAWLKKRRMEREKKEKEDKEAAASGKAAGLGADSDLNEVQKPALVVDTQAAKAKGASPVPALLVQPETPNLDRNEGDDLQLEEEGEADRVFEGARTEGDSEGEDEDDEEEDDAARQSDDEEENEDLTAAEIEEEERLAEEARRTTGGAGREVFHSHEHHASTYTMEAPKDKKGSHIGAGMSSKIGTPTPSADVSRRGSPIPNRMDFPRTVSTGPA